MLYACIRILTHLIFIKIFYKYLLQLQITAMITISNYII